MDKIEVRQAHNGPGGLPHERNQADTGICFDTLCIQEKDALKLFAIFLPEEMEETA